MFVWPMNWFSQLDDQDGGAVGSNSLSKWKDLVHSLGQIKLFKESIEKCCTFLGNILVKH